MKPSAERPVLGEMASFPMLAQSAKSPRDLENIETSLTRLRNSIAADQIPNPRYNDAKFFLARAVDECWRSQVAAAWPKDSESLGVSREVSSKNMPRYIGLADIKRLSAKMAAIRKTGVTAAKVLDVVEIGERVALELMQISQAFEWLKPRCVKLKRGADAERIEPILPEATMAARKLVRDVMSDALERVRAQYLEYVKVSVQEQAARFGDEILWKDRHSLTFADPRMITAAFTNETGTSNVLHRRRRDAKARLFKLAERTVTAVIDGFLTKNVEKIAAIVELKGSDAPLIELTKAAVEGGSLITAMEFTFGDGSSFIARNSIVYATSHHGTPYVRYPTTFHDVVMTNGEAMKNPSEEEMKTVFVAPAENQTNSPRM
jgi:hypothetical protein